MDRTDLRTMAAALLLSSSLGLAGISTPAYASPTPVGCAEMAMMAGDAMMMDGQNMEGMMDHEAMMMDPMMAGGSMDMMMKPDGSMDMAMMADMSMRARDGQCLASQSAEVQARAQGAWGDHAGARWVEAHEAELARSGR